MTRAVIIEDEEDSQFLLSSILKEYCTWIDLVGIAANYNDSIRLLKEEKPTVVFCDIQLEDCNAFQVLDALDKIEFHLIFTTAYSEYALKAFRYKALHYLLKPYAPDDVMKALDRVEVEPTGLDLIRSLGEYLDLPIRRERKRIGITTGDGIEMLEIGDILRIEADRSYATIHYGDRQKLIVSKPLREFEDSLPKALFFRAHTSHLVNIAHIERFLKDDGGSIIMSDGCSIPIARRRRKELSEILLDSSL